MNSSYRSSAARELRDALASVSDREVILLYVNRTEKLIYDITGDQSFSFGYLIVELPAKVIGRSEWTQS